MTETRGSALFEKSGPVMWNPLRHLLGAAKPRQLQACPDRPGPAHDTTPWRQAAGTEPDSGFSAVDSTWPEDELDRRFLAMLLHVPVWRDDAVGQGERRILDALLRLGQPGNDDPLVPRLPAALPRLMGLMRRGDSSVRELAEHLAHDPALLGEVMRLADSPRYRGSQNVLNLEQAVMMLGQTGLQQLITRAVLAPVFNASKGRFSRSAGTQLWEQAERCAHACAWLRRGQDDDFEAYLAGMVSNTGMIVALRVMDEHLSEGELPDSLPFQAALPMATHALSAHIARQWRLPEVVVEAVERHVASAGAGDPAAPAPDLAEDLRIAERSSRLHVMVERGGQPGTGFKEAASPSYRELERVFGL